MSPAEIVRAAVSAGMGGIALTDHQTARNAPAIAQCARRAGLRCLFGAEVQTAEEVHTLALFDSLDAAMELTKWIYAALPRRKNDPETFGDQPVVTWDDEIVEMDEHLLAAGCARTIPETSTFVHERGGLYIAAHIDRPAYSVVSGLGMVPEGVFDAVELSRTAAAEDWLKHTCGHATLRSSDAHHLNDVAKVWTEAECEFSIAGLSQAFKARATRPSPRLSSFI